MIRGVVALALLASTGCAYRATLQTNPVGAEVYIDNQPAGIAPLPIRVRGLYGRPEVRVELPGYRPFEVVLAKEGRFLSRLRWALTHPAVMLGLRPPPTRTLMLVPEHGPAGTWAPEDAER